MKQPWLEAAYQTLYGAHYAEGKLAEVAHRTLLDGSIAAEEDRLGPWFGTDPWPAGRWTLVKSTLDSPVK